MVCCKTVWSFGHLSKAHCMRNEWFCNFMISWISLLDFWSWTGNTSAGLSYRSVRTFHTSSLPRCTFTFVIFFLHCPYTFHRKSQPISFLIDKACKHVNISLTQTAAQLPYPCPQINCIVLRQTAKNNYGNVYSKNDKAQRSFQP